MRSAISPDRSALPLSRLDSAGRETLSAVATRNHQPSSFDNFRPNEIAGVGRILHRHDVSPSANPHTYRVRLYSTIDLHLAYAVASATDRGKKCLRPKQFATCALFKNGRNQAVRIPREFELPGNEAILRRDESGRLILEALPRRSLLDLLSTWKPSGEKDRLPAIEDRPAEPIEI
jgi:antitoxin VapB